MSLTPLQTEQRSKAGKASWRKVSRAERSRRMRELIQKRWEKYKAQKVQAA